MTILKTLGCAMILALLFGCNAPSDDASSAAYAAPTGAQKSAGTDAAPAETSALAAAPSGLYELEKKHGYISFSYSHKGFSNPHVGFRSFDVALDLDTEAPQQSTLSVTIDANSIDSRVEEFDGHLKGDKMFATASHPQITFESRSIAMTGVNTMNITGDLTIKGITKPVVLAARVNKAAFDSRKNVTLIGVSANTRVNRSDWDLGYASPMVGEEVNISIEVELMSTK